MLKCPKTVTVRRHGSRKQTTGPCGLAVMLRLIPYGMGNSGYVHLVYRCTAGHELESLPSVPQTLSELEDFVNQRLGE